MADGLKKINTDIKSVPLKKDFWFWFLTLAPILLSLVIGLLFAYNENYKFNPSIEGIKKLSEEFKFFIYSAGLSIPISGIYAAIKRSEETHHQIELTQEQNRFTNYFKHLEEFIKHIEKKKIEIFIPPSQMHKFVYPDFTFAPSDQSILIYNRISEFLYNKIGLRVDIECDLVEIHNILIDIHLQVRLQHTFKLNDKLIDFFDYLAYSLEFSPFSTKLEKIYIKASEKTPQIEALDIYYDTISAIELQSFTEKYFSEKSIYYILFYIFNSNYRNTPLHNKDKILKKIESLSTVQLQSVKNFAEKRITMTKQTYIVLDIITYLHGAIETRKYLTN